MARPPMPRLFAEKGHLNACSPSSGALVPPEGVLLIFALPESFVQFMRDVYGAEAANAWFERLPALLEECAERWQLELLPPFEQLSFHYVAPAVRADGTPVILKTCALTDEFEHGLAALRLFDGRGIARLL